jgi:hypothetical protein
MRSFLEVGRLELDVVSGQGHERFLERGLLRRQLVKHHLVRRSRLADLDRGQPADLEQAWPSSGHGHIRPAQQRFEPGCLRRTNENKTSGSLLDEVLGAHVGDLSTPSDHDQVVRRERHLAHQVRGDEDRPSLGGQTPQEMPHPEDALGVEAVDRLVEHHRRRVSEQRRRDSEPLAHPERELPGSLLRHVVQPNQVDQLVDSPAADPVGLRQREQVVVGRTAGVDRASLEQGPDLMQRGGVVAVVLAVNGHVARTWGVELEDQPHRRRLA